MKRLISLVPAAVGLAVYALTVVLFPSDSIDPEAAAWSAPMTGADRIFKYEFDIRTADGAAGPTYELGYRSKAWNHAMALKKRQSVQRDWVSRGPGNVGGRSRSVIVDPDDPTGDTWFAGSVSGGVWKTTDAGQSWQNLTSDLPILSTTSLAMAMSNPDVIYAGTGEGFAALGAPAGDGIWKSTDGGETWTQLPTTVGSSDFRYVYRIIVDPDNENTIVVAANLSIQRSTDGGSTFSEVFRGQDGSFDVGEVQQVIATPGNFSIQYAAVNGQGIYKSADAGLHWSQVCTDFQPDGRVELAVSPIDPNWLYASVDFPAETSRLYVSTDAGATCARVADQFSEPNWLSDPGPLGWYTNAIAADPFDTRRVFVSGPDTWRINLGEGTTTREGLIGMATSEVTGFLTFVNFTTQTLQGLGLGPDEGAVDVTNDDFVSVEIRWGPGRSQMGHRFQVPSDSTSGVHAISYSYQDYVEVPFEVWDVTNNRQLMVSFRDQQRDGHFNLLTSTDQGREYVFVNAIPYNANAPDPGIMRAGGHTQKLIYFLWFISNGGWDPGSIPTSKFSIKWGVETVRLSTSVRLTQWQDWFSKPQASSHADVHSLVISNVNQSNQNFRIVCANDGGISLSENAGQNWQMRTAGYVTTQFYGADKAPTEDRYIGGMQDNSGFLSPANSQSNSSWTIKTPGGDGFEVNWHASDPEQILITNQGNGIYKSTDGGSSFVTVTGAITDDDVFITRLAKSRVDPDLVFAVGQSGIWRSDDFADNWTLSPIPAQDWKQTGNEADVRISDANPQIVWAGSGVTNAPTRRLNLSTDGGLTFHPVDVLDNSIGFITGIETHPFDENTAYLLFSIRGEPKILRTTDLGASWEDISGFSGGSESDNGFPDVATYSLLVMPHNPNEIWAGTEIGLFISEDNGATWSFADDGLPSVAIWQMRIVGDQVVLATYGRGVWSVTIPELLTAPPPDIAVAPRLKDGYWNVTGAVSMDLEFRSAFDSTQIFVDGALAGSVGATEPGRKVVTAPYSPGSERDITAQAVAYQNGKTFYAPMVEVTAFPRPPRTGEYINEFQSLADDDDFAGEGFTMERFPIAWLTTSEYPPNSNLTFTLTKPIQVSDVNSMMTWSDIALVEPGLAGFDWTQPGFRDYVIVEASTNGVNWTPLVDGYDANFDATWKSLYPSKQRPSLDLMRDHTVDLRSFYDVGQIIFIRFRLYSDNINQGAGWFVDRLEIQQGSPVANEAIDELPTEYSLEANYPNPFNPSTSIRFAIPQRSNVTVRIFDSNGRLVQTLASGDYSAGTHTVTWDASGVASGTYFYRLEAEGFSQTRKMQLLK